MTPIQNMPITLMMRLLLSDQPNKRSLEIRTKPSKSKMIRLKSLRMGTLNPATDGGVYFTDTTGSGKRRQKPCKNWIHSLMNMEEHQKSKAPEQTTGKTRDGGGITSNDIPVGYSLTTAIDTTGYITSTYPWGQCTWYVFNRGKQVGVNFDPFMGNGGQWMNKPGFTTTHTPTEHSALSFSPGCWSRSNIRTCFI